MRAVISGIVFSRLVKLKTVNLDLHFNDGRKLKLVASEVNFENEDEFHRAELAFQIESQEQTNTLIIEGHGDPTDLEAFDATGYVNIKGLRLDDLIPDSAAKLVPPIVEHSALRQSMAHAEVWFDVHPGGATDFLGDITILCLLYTSDAADE